MDLFGSAPNFKCSNEAVSYNATACSRSSKLGPHLGFDCITASVLLLDNSPSSLVLLDPKGYSVQTFSFLSFFFF